MKSGSGDAVPGDETPLLDAAGPRRGGVLEHHPAAVGEHAEGLAGVAPHPRNAGTDTRRAAPWETTRPVSPSPSVSTYDVSAGTKRASTSSLDSRPGMPAMSPARRAAYSSGNCVGVLVRGQPARFGPMSNSRSRGSRTASRPHSAATASAVWAARARSEVHRATGREPRHERRDLLGLRQPDVVERDVGVALGPAGVVPGGAPVAQEDQAPHVSVSGMTGQSLQSRSRA